MSSSSNDTNSEYKDFCGEHEPNFALIDKAKLEKLIVLISKGAPFQNILDLFQNFTYLIAPHAVYLFSQNKITREQASTLLELCEMKNAFKDIKIINLLDKNNNFSKETELQLLHFASLEEQKKFLAELKNKPRSEHYYFVVEIPKKDMDNEGIQGLLVLADKLKIIKLSYIPTIQRFNFKEQATPITPPVFHVTCLSVGARDALTKAKFGKHAKSLFTRLGQFSINDIGRSIKNKGRYAAIHYPNIDSGNSFHNVTARTFYLSLHDEAHRRLISSIPNPLYDNYLYAIEVIRMKTSSQQSKELWDATDMEIGIFIDIGFDKVSNITTSDEMTKYFNYYLNANAYSTDKPINLFQASPLCDTTWVLIIDMVLNPDQWKKSLIEPDNGQFKFYETLYQFALKHKNLLENESSPARQVAIIKSKYFNLPELAKDADIKFTRKNRHLQVEVNGEPILLMKNDCIDFYRLEYLIQTDPSVIDKIKDAPDKLVSALRYYEEEINYLISNKKISPDDLFGSSPYKYTHQFKYIDDLIKKLDIPNDVVNSIIINDLKHPLIAYLFKADFLTINEFKTLPSKFIENLKKPIIADIIAHQYITVNNLKMLPQENIDLLIMKLSLMNNYNKSDFDKVLTEINLSSKQGTVYPKFEMKESRERLVSNQRMYVSQVDSQQSNSSVQYHHRKRKNKIVDAYDIMAGIWERWVSQEQSIDSCCIITVPANKMLSSIHDRMPAIITTNHYDAWLDRSLHNVTEIKHLLNPPYILISRQRPIIMLPLH